MSVLLGGELIERETRSVRRNEDGGDENAWRTSEDERRPKRVRGRLKGRASEAQRIKGIE